MKCTSKEQDTCNVEKMGCKGCYYDNKIEIGEYIRTKDGYIAKVKNIVCKGYPIKALEDSIICDDENKTIIKPEYIVKHSKNIINLIEKRRLCKQKINT